MGEVLSFSTVQLMGMIMMMMITMIRLKSMMMMLLLMMEIAMTLTKVGSKFWPCQSSIPVDQMMAAPE